MIDVGMAQRSLAASAAGWLKARGVWGRAGAAQVQFTKKTAPTGALRFFKPSKVTQYRGVVVAIITSNPVSPALAQPLEAYVQKQAAALGVSAQIQWFSEHGT